MINFLFTSLSLQNISLYLSATQQYISHQDAVAGSKFYTELRGNKWLSTGHNNNLVSSKYENDVFVACGTYPGQNLDILDDFINILLKSYLTRPWDSEHLPEHYQDYSCILYSDMPNVLWMLSDHIGTTPLWHGFIDDYYPDSQVIKARNFVVTTDLLLGHQLGIMQFNPLGSNQIFSINLHTNSLELFHIPKFIVNPAMHKLSWEEKASLLFTSTKQLLTKTITTHHEKQQNDLLWLMEIDAMFWSSGLLSCVLDKVLQQTINNNITTLSATTITQAIRHTRPLLTIPNEAEFFPKWIQPLIPFLPAKHHLSRTEDYLFKLYERAHYCVRPIESHAIDKKQQHHKQQSVTYLAFENGQHQHSSSQKDPLDVYFQNLLCGMNKVNMQYPFQEMEYQALLASITGSGGSAGKTATNTFNTLVMLVASHPEYEKDCPVELFIGSYGHMKEGEAEVTGSRQWNSLEERHCHSLQETNHNKRNKNTIGCYDKRITTTTSSTTATNAVSSSNDHITIVTPILIPSIHELVSTFSLYYHTIYSSDDNKLPSYLTIITLPTIILSDNNKQQQDEEEVIQLLSNFICSFTMLHDQFYSSSASSSNRILPLLLLTNVDNHDTVNVLLHALQSFPIFVLNIPSSSASPVSLEQVSLQILYTLSSSRMLLFDYVFLSDSHSHWIQHPIQYIFTQQQQQGQLDKHQYDVYLLLDISKQLLFSQLMIFTLLQSDCQILLHTLYTTTISTTTTTANANMSWKTLLLQYIFQEGKYSNGKLSIHAFPMDSIPSAYEYFNQRSFLTLSTTNSHTPVINKNIILIRDVYLYDWLTTKHRLLQYGLWYVHYSFTSLVCHPSLVESTWLASGWYQFDSISTTFPLSIMRIDSPMQYSTYQVEDILTVSMNIETHLPHFQQQQQPSAATAAASLASKTQSIPMGNTGASRTPHEYARMHVYLDSEALSGFDYSVTFQLPMIHARGLGSGGTRYHPNPTQRKQALTTDVAGELERFGLSMMIPKTNMQLTVDIAPIMRQQRQQQKQNGSDLMGGYYGVDYADLSPEQVFYQAMQSRITFVANKKKHNKTLDKSPSKHINPPPDLSSFASYDPTKPIEYHIKVMAFTRTQSLSRLLSSIANAWYNCDSLDVFLTSLSSTAATSSKEPVVGCVHRDISLDIYIDGPRNANERILVQKVIQVAKAFQWFYGPKHVIVREKNVGLAGQWTSVWSPKHSNEVAFLFEDDLEVSPYYFQYTQHLLRAYYTSHNASSLSSLHYRLYTHLLTKLSLSSSLTDDKEVNEDDLWSSFVSQYAGSMKEVMVYGVCLQKQALDPTRYPKTARMHTGHRPYLYSTLGTWGPMFFPGVWKTFLLWWEHKHKQNDLKYHPISEKLVSNRFLSENPHVWSPFFTRFVYEIGGKCLYSNLPGNFTLIQNYRETGENYDHAWGPYARLLTATQLLPIVAYYHPSNNSTSSSTLASLTQQMEVLESQEEVDSLGMYIACCSSVLNWYELITDWQYDFNGRNILSVSSMTSSFPSIWQSNHNNTNNNASKEVSAMITTILQPFVNLLTWSDSLLSTHYHHVVNATILPSLSLSLFTIHEWMDIRQWLRSILPSPLIAMIRYEYLEWSPLLPLLHYDEYNIGDEMMTMPLPVVYTTSSTLCAANKDNDTIPFHCISLLTNNITTNAHHQVTTAAAATATILVINHALLLPSTTMTVTSTATVHEYLVILDVKVCSAAPVQLTLSLTTNNTNATTTYVQTHAMCRIDSDDAGVIVYRLKDRVDRMEGRSNADTNSTGRENPRFILSKRLNSLWFVHEIVSVDSNALFV